VASDHLIGVEISIVFGLKPKCRERRYIIWRDIKAPVEIRKAVESGVMLMIELT